MRGLQQYVISVAAAAWIVGCMAGLVENQAKKALLRLVGGIFLLVTLLAPLSDLDLDRLLLKFSDGQPDGQIYISRGEEYSREALAAVIVSETEAYILDKAKNLGADLAVEVGLTNDEIPVPAEARLQGAVSPQVRQALSSVMEQALGITKENQIWIS